MTFAAVITMNGGMAKLATIVELNHVGMNIVVYESEAQEWCELLTHLLLSSAGLMVLCVVQVLR